jgi:hypothetical protein
VDVITGHYAELDQLPGDDSFLSAFQASVKALRRIIDDIDGDQWPNVLADERIDRLISRAAARVRRS